MYCNCKMARGCSKMGSSNSTQQSSSKTSAVDSKIDSTNSRSSNNLNPDPIQIKANSSTSIHPNPKPLNSSSRSDSVNAESSQNIHNKNHHVTTLSTALPSSKKSEPFTNSEVISDLLLKVKRTEKKSIKLATKNKQDLKTAAKLRFHIDKNLLPTVEESRVQNKRSASLQNKDIVNDRVAVPDEFEIFETELQFMDYLIKKTKLSNKNMASKAESYLKDIDDFLKACDNVTHNTPTPQAQHIHTSNRKKSNTSVLQSSMLKQDLTTNKNENSNFENTKHFQFPEKGAKDIYTPRVEIKPTFLKGNIPKLDPAGNIDSPNNRYTVPALIKPVFLKENIEVDRMNSRNNFNAFNSLNTKIGVSKGSLISVEDNVEVVSDSRNIPNAINQPKIGIGPVFLKGSENLTPQSNNQNNIGYKDLQHNNSQQPSDVETNNFNIPVNSGRNNCILLTEIDRFEKILNASNIEHNFRETVRDRLLNLQNCISKMLLSISQENIQSWVDDNVNTDNEDSISTTSETTGPSYPVNLRVNCQFCDRVMPDIFMLSLHVQKECTVLKRKKFCKKNYPLSVFQITYKNKIKCNKCQFMVDNIPSLLQHKESKQHKSVVKDGNPQHPSKTTSLLYCSVCKIRVPDNTTQFHLHITNKEHEHLRLNPEPKQKEIDKEEMIKNGIHFVLNSSQNCRCNLCNCNFNYSQETITAHMLTALHGECLKLIAASNIPPCQMVLCQVCDISIDVNGILKHLLGNIHAEGMNVFKKKGRMQHCYCLFCDQPALSIEVLAEHQKQCRKMLEMHNDNKSTLSNQLKHGSDKTVTYNKNYRHECLLCNYECSFAEWNEHLKALPHVRFMTAFQTKGITLLMNSCSTCNLSLFGDMTAFDEHKTSVKHLTSTLKQVNQSVPTATMVLPTNTGSNILPASTAATDLSSSKDIPSLLTLKIESKIMSLDKFANQICITMADRAKKLNSKAIASICKSIVMASEVYVCGSRAYNIAFEDNGLDLFCDFESIHLYHGKKFQSDNEQIRLLYVVSKKLQDSNKFSNIEVITTDKPCIKCFYEEAAVTCYISCLNGFMDVAAKYLRALINVDHRVRKLLLVVKIWANSYGLVGNGCLSNYAMTLLVIHVLQKGQLLPTLKRVREDFKTESATAICGWNTSVELNTVNTPVKSTLQQLFVEFLQFYSDFNFSENVICLPFSNMISRSTLKFELEFLSNMDFDQTFETEFSSVQNMCVMDPFELNRNITKSISTAYVEKFQDLCKDTSTLVALNYFDPEKLLK